MQSLADTHKTWPGLAGQMVAIGSALVALAVASGAFAAHALRPTLEPAALALWRTASDYQMSQALGLILMGLAAIAVPAPRLALLHKAGALLGAGLIGFCGSLYLLALGAPRALGMLTPVGGCAMILAWFVFAVAIWPMRLMRPRKESIKTTQQGGAVAPSWVTAKTESGSPISSATPTRNQSRPNQGS